MCVTKRASILRNGRGSICCRKSGPQSIKTRVCSVSNKAEVRKRLSLGSLLLHTLQLQPMTGTPLDVPVPRKVKVIFGTNDSFILAVRESDLTDSLPLIYSPCFKNTIRFIKKIHFQTFPTTPSRSLAKPRKTI